MTKIPVVRRGRVVGHQSCKYDAWGRMVEVKNAAGLVVSAMEYDGSGRRIGKVVTNSQGMNGTFKFIFDGQQIVEERNGSDQVIKQNVWGPTYVDELLQVGINTDPTDATESDCETFNVVLAHFLNPSHQNCLPLSLIRYFGLAFA